MRVKIMDDPTPVEGKTPLDVLRAMRERTPLDRDLGDHAWIDRLAERAMALNYNVDPPPSAWNAEDRADRLLAEMARLRLADLLTGEPPAEEVARG